MVSLRVTHFGYNRTDSPNRMQADGWREVSWRPPAYYEVSFYGKPIYLPDWFKHLVKEQRRLCRIWVKYEDGSTKCVYWYETDVLDDIATWGLK